MIPGFQYGHRFSYASSCIGRHFWVGRITRNLSIDRLRKKFYGKRPDVHMADVIEEMDQLNVNLYRKKQL